MKIICFFCLESYGPVLRNVKDKHEKLCHVCGPWFLMNLHLNGMQASPAGTF